LGYLRDESKSSLDFCFAFWGHSIPELSFRGEKDFLPERKLLNFVIQELRTAIVLIFANERRMFSYKASSAQRKGTEQFRQCNLEQKNCFFYRTISKITWIRVFKI